LEICAKGYHLPFIEISGTLLNLLENHRLFPPLQAILFSLFPGNVLFLHRCNSSGVLGFLATDDERLGILFPQEGFGNSLAINHDPRGAVRIGFGAKG